MPSRQEGVPSNIDGGGTPTSSTFPVHNQRKGEGRSFQKGREKDISRHSGRRDWRLPGGGNPNTHLPTSADGGGRTGAGKDLHLP